ncbi:S41 family peptidase [Flavihumibacter fluvii]|uniref:S41 family peptidase n=1 Tax=Flavihumibacter fluvii TaxID=2838157 RepID=UPI001BDF10CE|nr:S41 family peptidase [Flavihumibacter fluvii]ULQ53469.1 S41 family peptidase [Flavihumibacter fluvii]
MKGKNTLKVWLPMLFSVMMIMGMVIGYKLRNNTQTATSMFKFTQKRAPIQEVLDLVMLKYVDKVDSDTLGNAAIQDMLTKLDPHSNFIPASHLAEVNEGLQGNFQGIGVEFQIFQDTVNVLSVLPGGPSEKAGLQVGDKFLKVGDTVVTGNITSDKIRKLLRGPGGSTVTTSLLRNGHSVVATIKRGIIPIPSLEAGYLIAPGTGYIKLNKFSENTYEEFMGSLEKLQGQGMLALILDLRGNGGGILGEAIDIADEFLDGDKLIVFTEGNNTPKLEYHAKRKGLFEKGKLVLLMDEQSASASEVLAGALQDWDRAEIVGRRSFGKGLVQEQYNLSDGSALRLTIARYYTPSGRSIQKPYDKGIDDYDNDILKRYRHGELVNADSNKVANGTAFKTNAGKTVYGGGGIMPDYFIAADTSTGLNALGALYQNNTISNFTYLYYVSHSTQINSFDNAGAFEKGFNWSEQDWKKFVEFASRDSISLAGLPENDKNYVTRRMKGLLARFRWRNEGYYQVLNPSDEMVKKSLKILQP